MRNQKAETTEGKHWKHMKTLDSFNSHLYGRRSEPRDTFGIGASFWCKVWSLSSDKQLRRQGVVRTNLNFKRNQKKLMLDWHNLTKCRQGWISCLWLTLIFHYISLILIVPPNCVYGLFAQQTSTNSLHGWCNISGPLPAVGAMPGSITRPAVVLYYCWVQRFHLPVMVQRRLSSALAAESGHLAHLVSVTGLLGKYCRMAVVSLLDSLHRL